MAHNSCIITDTYHLFWRTINSLLNLLNEALLLSYLYGDLDYAQRLVDKHSGKGTPLLDKNVNWLRKEKFTDTKAIGVHLDINGKKVETDAGMIVYSKTGTHVYPRKEIK